VFVGNVLSRKQKKNGNTKKYAHTIHIDRKIERGGGEQKKTVKELKPPL